MGWLDYSDISCYYGVKIDNIDNMQELLKGVLSVCSEEDQKSHLTAVWTWWAKIGHENEKLMSDDLHDISNYLNKLGIPTRFASETRVIGILGKKYNVGSVFRAAGETLLRNPEASLATIFPMVPPSQDAMDSFDRLFLNGNLKPKLQYVPYFY